jgi:hypothetical protein
VLLRGGLSTGKCDIAEVQFVGIARRPDHIELSFLR